MTSPRLVAEQVFCVDAVAEDVAEGLLSLHCPLPQIWALLQLSPLLSRQCITRVKAPTESSFIGGVSTAFDSIPLDQSHLLPLSPETKT